MATLGFSQQVGPVSGPCPRPLRGGTCLQSAHLTFLGLSEDIDGLEVVGRGQPFSTVTVKEFLVFGKSQRSSSGDMNTA